MRSDLRHVCSCFEMSLLLVAFLFLLSMSLVFWAYFIVCLEMVAGSRHLKFALERPFRDKRQSDEMK